MKTSAIVLAAGSCSRMGSNVKKQYIELNGHEILWYSIRAFQESEVDGIILVCSEDDMEKNGSYRTEFSKLSAIVPGGRERYNSVHCGLIAADPCKKVLIHDGARPFVSVELINRCICELDNEDACVAAVPSKDTVKIITPEGYVKETPDRSLVWNMQTPQCFRYDVVKEAYDILIKKEENEGLNGLNVTDDAMVVEYFGNARIKMIRSDYDNIKITTPEDLRFAEWKERN